MSKIINCSSLKQHKISRDCHDLHTCKICTTPECDRDIARLETRDSVHYFTECLVNADRLKRHTVLVM